MSPVPPTRPRGVPSRPPNMASRGRRRAPSWPAPGSGGPAGEVPPSGERLKRGPRSTPSGEGDADPCRYFPQPCPRPGRSLPSHAEAHPAWIAATLSPAAVSALGTLRPDCISPGCIYGKSERTALSLEKSLSDNPFPWSYCSINHTEHISNVPEHLSCHCEWKNVLTCSASLISRQRLNHLNCKLACKKVQLFSPRF
ncbi:uncharacterized protein LOC119709392 isoform X2 [Motacilla alba alba]|uniref:uncharacterized protein LOC119709392 isoform X2 n=1 Tax=Motacilla alba alba TaxID=1094192 RepID=UPI0018D4FC2C|nr:uncharacterized protein LOC119709392 isoform X2 [Motacilla alba alba]